MPISECRRCGVRWETSAARKNVLLCSSCRARKMKTVNSVAGKCLPWHGMFARDGVTPVDDDGMPVLPGNRICGRKDCVNTEHLGKGS